MIEIVEPGFFTTVQDWGRHQYACYGVPPSGPMDRTAFSHAQQLVGNFRNEAILECTLKGPSLRFESEAVVAVCGAPVTVHQNQEEATMDIAFKCFPGDLLKLGTVQEGMRTYLAFGGGLKIPKVLGSRSFFYPLTASRLKKGDQIETGTTSEWNILGNTSPLQAYFKTSILKATKGPEWNVLSNHEQKMLSKTPFEIGSNSRMGYRLNGIMESNSYNLPSSSIVPGVVQLTPNGQLVALMADAQVTGGYPRVLILTDEAMAILAQKRTGQQISFEI